MSLQPILEIQGVKFFENASSLLHYEKTHWAKKAISLIQGFGTLFSFALTKMSLILYRYYTELMLK